MSPANVSNSTDRTVEPEELLRSYRKGFYRACETYGRSLLEIADGQLTQPSSVCCPAT
jgi:hypothetical protein